MIYICRMDTGVRFSFVLREMRLAMWVLMIYSIYLAGGEDMPAVHNLLSDVCVCVCVCVCEKGDSL